MSRTVGRHRARRQPTLRRPAVAATASLSALALSGAGYSSADAAGAHAGGDQPLGGPAQRAALLGAQGDSVQTVRQQASQARTRAHAQVRATVAQRRAAMDTRRAQVQRATQAAATAALADGTTMRSLPAADQPSPAPEPQQRSGEEARRVVARPAAVRAQPAQAPRAEAEREQPAQRASRSGERAEPAAPSGSPRSIARAMVADRGWGGEFSCLEKLWTKESSWRVGADNPTSSAYGIPQALPGSKMASAGADWRTNPATQIRWGLGYIQDRYGSPCGAWAHSVANDWY